jgi:hypothetical protein
VPLRLALGLPVTADPLEGVVVVDVDVRPSVADLPLSNISAAMFDVAQKAPIPIDVVLGWVLDELHAIPPVDQVVHEA